MSSKSAIVLLALFCVFQCVTCRKLPSFISVCRRNSADLNQCLRKSAEQVRPYLSNGIQEMHVPPLDPLLVPHAELNAGETFKAIFDNILLYGLSNFTLQDLNLDFDQNVINIQLMFPMMRAKADYNIKGRILILQLNGEGKCEGNYTNLEVHAVISGQRTMRKGKEHINFDQTTLDLRFGQPNTLVFENIFKGNTELTEQTNKIISENIEGIMGEIKPVFDDTVAQLVLGLLRGVFDRYSLDELFPVD